VIDADVIDGDWINERVRASGAVRLEYAGFLLSADEVTADRTTGDVLASGAVEVTQDGRRLRGESIRYNLRTREGILEDAWASEQGVFLRGREINVSPQRLELHDAYVTTCDRPEPHYAFGAKRIVLTAAEGDEEPAAASGHLTLDRSRVTYRGRRLLTLPRYTVRVGEMGERGNTPVPTFGVSGDDGPYVALGYTFATLDEKTTADFGYRYTTERGIRGHLRARRQVGAAQLMAEYVRRDDPADRALRIDELEANLADVLVDREPEFGLYLPEYTIGTSLRLQTELSYGSYTETGESGYPTLASADRATASGILRLRPYHVARRVKLSHAIGFRRSRYDPGDRFRARFFSSTADVTISPRARFTIAYISRESSGETPFLFDALGPESELVTELWWQALPEWRLHLVNSYDRDEARVRDAAYEVTRTAHCLEYTVGWRKPRNAFYFEIGLTALAGFEQPG
jgi:hypothetical protein